MILSELLSLPIASKKILILGKPSAGKTWLSYQIGNQHVLTHTDDYKEFTEPQAIQAILDDMAYCTEKYRRPSLVEGMLGYALLLEGAKNQTYHPDIIIEIELSAGKQRELYLANRDPNKIKYLKDFNLKCIAMLDEYYKLVPEADMPTWYTFKNEW